MLGKLLRISRLFHETLLNVSFDDVNFDFFHNNFYRFSNNQHKPANFVDLCRDLQRFHVDPDRYSSLRHIEDTT
jgi:hypothetical protein